MLRQAEALTFDQIADGIRHLMEVQDEPKAFVRGETRIPLNVPTYGALEVIEALDSLLTTWVTMGKKVEAFERMWADYIGRWMAVMTNSGSSANLVALSALGFGSRDEIITPALTWATTVFPIAQVGAVPVLVDVDRETYNISPEALEAAITPKTRAIMPVHLLGNPCDMDAIMDIAQRHGLYVIEDACEAHGAEYHGQKIGSFGDLATFSFFFSHHISTIEGGTVLGNNSIWIDACRSLRAHGWIREMSTRKPIAAENPDIDPRFLFAHAGYNFRPTEIQGAFGIHQVPRLEGLIEIRRVNAAYLNEALARYRAWIMLPTEATNTRHSYFAYAITVREGAPFTKRELVEYLEARGLETRPIEAGNIAVQPAMKHVNHRVSGSLENAQYIHDNAFFFGIHQGVGAVEREAIAGYFDDFMRGHR